MPLERTVSLALIAKDSCYQESFDAHVKKQKLMVSRNAVMTTHVELNSLRSTVGNLVGRS